MRKIKIQKTDTGYVLRQSLCYTWLKGLNAAICLALGIYGFSIPWWARDGHLTLDFPNVFCWLVGLGVFALGAYSLYLTVGKKMVFDREGVHLYRLYFRAFTMPWREIKSWGVKDLSVISYQFRRGRKHYEFFVSSDKKNVSSSKCICMELSQRESVTILKEDLMSFCVDRIPPKAKRVGLRIGGRELVEEKGKDRERRTL